ncbi:MAG: hypothetical protein HQK79_07140 [Desulfobacterales bacterium]|nr:hypothetical protein [Desulfobacterales bacterium]
MKLSRRKILKKIAIYSLILFLFITYINYLYAFEPPRKPFIVLNINNKTYNPSEEIKVRPGEKIIVKALLMGGRRDFCMFPQKYANIGKNTEITSEGENGMSFLINSGQFRGTWILAKERSIFKSDDSVKINMLKNTMNMENEAQIEIPSSGFSKIYFKVTSESSWHYVRVTPAGKKEEDETNKGENTFYFIIASEEGVWYQSANINVNGEENFSIRNRLDDVQKIFNIIEKKLSNKDYQGAKFYEESLKTAIYNLKSSIDAEKQKNPNLKAEVIFLGLPTDLSIYNANKIQALADKWKEMHLIAQGNVLKVNEILLNNQLLLSNNSIKSVFKNYLNWGTSIPSGAIDLITLYDPKCVLTPFDIPRKIMDWYSEAEKDASILQEQVQTIKVLTALRKFYLDRMDNYIKESKEFHKIIDSLKPAKEIESSLKGYFLSLTWAKWKGR